MRVHIIELRDDARELDALVHQERAEAVMRARRRRGEQTRAEPSDASRSHSPLQMPCPRAKAITTRAAHRFRVAQAAPAIRQGLGRRRLGLRGKIGHDARYEKSGGENHSERGRRPSLAGLRGTRAAASGTARIERASRNPGDARCALYRQRRPERARENRRRLAPQGTGVPRPTGTHGATAPGGLLGHFRRRRQGRVHGGLAQRLDGCGDAARVQDRHRRQHRRVDCTVRVSRRKVRRDADGGLHQDLAEGCPQAAQLDRRHLQRRDGGQRAAMGAHAQVRDGGPPEGSRRGICEGPVPVDRHRRYRCAPPRHLGHGKNRDLRHSRGIGPVRERLDGFRRDSRWASRR